MQTHDDVRHVGVDGCAGWIAVSKRSGELIYRIVSNVLELTATFASAERIPIDIPIGLPQRNAPERACEQEKTAGTAGAVGGSFSLRTPGGAFLERVLDAEPRRRVLADDVLDALAAFVTAQMLSPHLKSLRGDPAVDEEGFPSRWCMRNPKLRRLPGKLARS